MYKNLLKISTRRREMVERRSGWHSDKPRRSSYHSGPGVYGHREKIPRQFQVPEEELESRSRNSNFYRFVSAYREHGHKQARVDPITPSKPRPLAELRPESFGLSLTDRVPIGGMINVERPVEATVAEALDLLKSIYSGTMSAEFCHLESEEEREWFGKNFELVFREPVDKETRRAVAREMLKSQAFERFLAVKFSNKKRYGGEGAESMVAFFLELYKQAALVDTLEEIVLCMAHRGRMSLLACMMGFPLERLFGKIKGLPEFPDEAKVTGDFETHFTSSLDFRIGAASVRVGMLANPSHLESVNPVAMGRTRAIMQLLGDGDYSDDATARWGDKVLNVQVHGDASYPGQGVNHECLGLTGVPHFEIGGTVHLMVNNQLGFTTPPSRGRSSRYCTDLAKSICAPVVHVNADDPEMVVRATRIAFRYQREFRKDVFVDLNCFRLWGHNELDDPTFTNPLVYKIIRNRPSIPDRYLSELVKAKVLTPEEGVRIVNLFTAKLGKALEQVDAYVPPVTYFTGRWSLFQQAESTVTTWDTGVDVDLLKFVGRKSVEYDDQLCVHPTVRKSHVLARLKRIDDGANIDWSTAEAMAIGSLLYQGYNVRISGEDIGRGTFSQRHAMLVDQETEAIRIPLNSMAEGQTGKLELANSILSEEAVLGYEYGMSITLPNTLTIWEAQFGDFINGAQMMIDVFVSGSEAKWMRSNGLTIVLPHGYDGAGPEHSSCKYERFLQMTDSREDRADGDDVNMHVVNPTTPAQYFHLLRRQMVRNFRKPLIIVGPKTLLRHPSATSSFEDMAPGTGFKPVIGCEVANENAVRKVILVSGKHYYALEKYRESHGIGNVAIVRVEGLCPFPVVELNEEIKKYVNASTFIWSQEEPQNMGAWSFIKPRFENLCGRQLRYAGREPLPTSAVGIGQLHARQAEEVVVTPFAMK